MYYDKEIFIVFYIIRMKEENKKVKKEFFFLSKFQIYLLI